MDMLISLTIISLAFVWLGYETDWLRVRILIIRGQVMELPSGIIIGESDIAFLRDFFKPAKRAQVDNEACWHCGNGHDRQAMGEGLLAYELCECGASIVYHPKRRRRSVSPNARLGRQLTAKFAPYTEANKRLMKRFA